MFKRFLSIIVLIAIHLYNVNSQESFHPETVFSAPDSAFIQHTVERGQTVYALSVIYDTTLDAIYRLNPDLKVSGLKAGETIRIPQQAPHAVFHTIRPKETLYSVSKRYNVSGESIIDANPGLSIKTFSAGKNILIPLDGKRSGGATGAAPSAGMEVEVNDLLKYPQGKTGDDACHVINIALLLPFGTVDKDPEMSGQNQRLIEYYEGFLLSLDSLKKTGISVNLNVYDTGERPESLARILDRQELKTNHLIIGGRTAEQIKSIADYARNNRIPYVVPFSSKADETLINPYVFQINPPQQYLYSRVAAAVAERYRDCHIVFVDMPDTSGVKYKFIPLLQADLSANGQPSKTVMYNASTFNSDIRAALHPVRKNVVILTSSSSEALVKILPPFRTMSELNASIEVSLFGYPEWQTYFKDHIDDFFRTNTCIYSVFYADNSDAKIQYFYRMFKNWFGKTPVNTYPKYSLLGYDTGMYFVRLFHRYGTDPDDSLEPAKYEGLQSGFNFKRISNWSGFVNGNIFLIDFLPNYTIRKTMIP
jgi:LysM repeat protein